MIFHVRPQNILDDGFPQLSEQFFGNILEDVPFWFQQYLKGRRRMMILKNRQIIVSNRQSGIRIDLKLIISTSVINIVAETTKQQTQTQEIVKESSECFVSDEHVAILSNYPIR
jgi:hypothetical protein